MIKKFLCIIASFFVIVINVNAVSVGDSVSLTATSIAYDSYISMKNADTTGYSTAGAFGASNKYTAYLNSSYYDVFCLDPNLSPNDNGSFEIHEELITRNYDSMVSSQSVTNVYKFDIGVLAIFEYFENESTLTGDQKYTAQMAALRVFIAGYGYYRSASSFLTIFQNTALLWSGTSYSSSSWYSRTVYGGSNYETAYTVYAYLAENSSYSALYADAKAAYTAAYDAIDNIPADAWKYVGEEAELISYTSTSTDKLTQQVTLTASNFENLSDSAKLTKLTVTKNSNVSATCTYDYYESGKESITINCNNISSMSISNGDKIIITLKLDEDYTYGDTEDCIDLEYKINYTIEDSSLTSGDAIYIIYDTADADFDFTISGTTSSTSSSSTTSLYQRYLVYIKGNGDENSFSSTVSGEFTVCGEDYIDCTPVYEIVTDCEDLIDSGDISATEENSSEWYASYYLADSNILQCVIDNTDEANNTLVASSCEYDYDLNNDNYISNTETDVFDNGMSGVDDNEYCTVSCTESYDYIKYSGVQSTDSGRYFKIGASITGTKSCYTSEIDYESFIDDIIEAQEEMVAAYNLYLSYKEATTLIDEESDIYSQPCGDTDECADSCSYTNYYLGEDDTYEHQNYKTYDNGEGSLTGKNKTETWNGERTGSETGKCGSVACGTNEDDSTKFCEVCGYQKCTDGDLEALEEDREDGMDAAEAALVVAQEKYATIIEDITSCSGGEITTSDFASLFTKSELDYNNDLYSLFSDLEGWTMLFVLNPVIEYSYTESYSSGTVSDYMKLNGVYSNEDNYLEIVYDSSSYYYNGSFKSTDYTSYGCLYNSNSNCYDIDYSDTNDSDNYDTREFIFCSTEKCEVVEYENFPTEDLKYVSAEVTKTVEYETPDAFYNSYPTGTVLYSKDSSVLDDEDDDIVLIDGLPVSLTTEKGAYTFEFTITNLGEYYDDCTGGRINEELSVLDPSIFDEDSYDYVCYFKINCPLCDVTTRFEWDPDDEKCVTCIVNNTFTMYFRTISITNSDALENDRELGYNWNYTYATTDTVYGFIGSKAEVTIEEIYELGDGTYSGDPILTVELTSTMANKIQEYNELNSSYSNDTLTCYDYGDYANVLCYSDLLTDWADDYPDNFEFYLDRTGNTNNDVSVYPDEGYWTLYTSGIINTTYSIGGPSWK